MTVTLLAVGRLGEKHWSMAAEEYAKRLSAFCRLDIREISEYRLPGSPSAGDIARAVEHEGKAILAALPERSKAVALCVEGSPMTSENFSAYIADAARETSRLAVIIGGSHGLSEGVKAKSAFRLSFSPMTFPHQLARIMALEQLYRAFSISAGTRYHK